LGDRQSSHPVKTLLQYFGKSLEALPGVAYPGFMDNRSTLNAKTGFKKNCCCKISRKGLEALLSESTLAICKQVDERGSATE